MKGLVYKENMMFIKGTDKKVFLFVAVAIVALIFTAGEYSGPLASIMFAMIIGMQNVLGFANDEKTDWKKYQLAMPVSAVSVVKAKYISVLCTTVISFIGSIVFNLFCCIIYRSFNIAILIASIAVAVVIPLLWTGIGLPLAYWFGFKSAQMIGLVAVAPVFYIVKHFENDAGFSVMTDLIISYGIITGIGTVVIFVVSMIISMAGYNRKG